MVCAHLLRLWARSPRDGGCIALCFAHLVTLKEQVVQDKSVGCLLLVFFSCAITADDAFDKYASGVEVESRADPFLPRLSIGGIYASH